jgi:hypothetical protein
MVELIEFLYASENPSINHDWIPLCLGEPIMIELTEFLSTSENLSWLIDISEPVMIESVYASDNP